MITVLHGDCRSLLPTAGPFDACVTDPPYELGFMGKTWDRSGIAFQPETWRAVFDALKPGAHLVAFGGSRTFHRMACAIEDAGFELRDTLCWLYGSGYPKSLNLPGGIGTALKPAWEPILLARKPLAGTVAANVLAHGVGGLNIDSCRVPTDENLNGGAYATRKGVCNDGWRMQNGGAGEYKQSVGRWPANLVHDGSDEVLDAFAAFGEKRSGALTAEHQKRGGFSHPAAYHAGSSRGGTNEYAGDTGTAARFFTACPWSAEEWTALASSAEPALCLSNPSVASVLNAAAISAHPGAALLGGSWSARSTNVTGIELSAICSLVIGLTRSFVLACSRGLPPARRILCNDHAQCVAVPGQTGTMTITASLWTSDGFAEAVTFAITLPNTALGAPALAVADSSRFYYSSKATADDRACSKHPTVKPIALMRWLCRLITPPGGHIVDPFAGSGTTGEAARLEGFSVTLIEQDAQYVADIHRRIGRASGNDAPLFASVS